MSEPLYMSKEGLLKLEAELKRLKYEERPRIVGEIKRAREMGDLSENAEYHAAKEAQGYLERKISEIQEKLTRVRAVDADQVRTDKAYLFAKVLVKDKKSGEEILYTLSPPEEDDVSNDIISIKSPIGAALLGKGVGEKVKIKVPVGILEYEIIKISHD